MYENFYGLKEKPFSLLPDPEYLYLSKKHEMGLTLLEYGVLNQAGFCVISGQAGAGKTTLIRHLLGRLGEDVTVGLLSNTHTSFGDLLGWVLNAFDLDYAGKSKTELYQTFVDFLVDQYAKNRYTILIVDEAQNMSPETLEELRMLSNVNADKDQVLQVIIVGQPGLLEKLRHPELEQFAQRIAVDYNLEPLSEEETHGYIQHRLGVAGGAPDIINTAARRAVYKHSGGVPRLINLLCDTALVYGYAEQAQVIDERIVNDVVMERGKHGMLPKFRDIVAVDGAEILDNLSEIIVESQGFEKEVPQQENEQTEMPVAASSGRGTSSLHVISGYGSNASRRTSSNASSDNNSRVEHVTRTAEESKTKIPNIDNKKSENDPVAESVAAEVAKLIREGAKTEESVSTGKDSSGNIAGDHSSRSQPKAETFEEFEEVIENHKNNKLSEAEDVSFRQAEPSEMSHDNHVPYKSDIIPVQRTARTPASGLSVGILGFAFGLLLATVVLIFSFTRGGFNSAHEVVKDEAKSGPVAEQFSGTDPNTTALESLQRERDAALAEARALQRERDAALAVAKAQQDLREAELKAEQARKREALAAAQAVNARERARAAELEAELARKRDQAKTVLPEPSQTNLSAEPAEAVLRSIEQERESSVAGKTPGPELVTVQPTAPVVVVPEQIAAEPKINRSIHNKAESFSPDPCKGPSAVFLSTCKK